MHGRLHHVILDCPEPRALAEFYAAMLGQSVTYDNADFVVVAADATSSGLAFQRAPGHRAPTWPDPAIPQEIHLDVMVEDVDEAEPSCSVSGPPGWPATASSPTPRATRSA